MVTRNYLQVEYSYGKSKQILMSVVRSTSCSGGWLRLVVQGFFGFIIVCSFILISLLTIHSHYQNNRPEKPPHCKAHNCRVTCNEAPFFGEFEREILQVTMEIESNCGSVALTLHNAMFINCTLPGHWLSSIRVDVSELEILGGNLRTIQSDSFQSRFGGGIRILILENITITTLAADTFIGLSTLEELHIKDCEIINIRHNALQAIDDTLKVLNIKSNKPWDPAPITGSSDFNRLRIVDFSMNQFNDILGHKSFSKLQHCVVLFLNSCNIISIGAGAFDHLNSLEILHLNNNCLTFLPYDIFNKIIPREPRINLQENYWNCSCNNNLRVLFKLGLLIVEPTCFFPLAFRGKKISWFEKHCAADPVPTLIDEDLYVFSGKSISTINHECIEHSSKGNSTVELCSPIPDYKCHSNIIDRPSIIETDKDRSVIGLFSPENNWLKPAFSVDSSVFSMVSLVFSGPQNYSLLWYHSTCPKEIYCMNHLPKLLRVYNDDLSVEYTFCRIFETPGGVIKDKCVGYNLAILQKANVFLYKSIVITVSIAIICLFAGAICVYALIHKNPILLKGNKRVVFVKHKTVDALILPAKKSLRDLPKDKSVGISSNIFVIQKSNTYPSEKLSRANSVRTNESNDPSYISALQPTEDQLAEWRITRNFEATYTYDATDSNIPTHSRMFPANALPYYTYESVENIYDTVKL